VPHRSQERKFWSLAVASTATVPEGGCVFAAATRLQEAEAATDIRRYPSDPGRISSGEETGLPAAPSIRVGLFNVIDHQVSDRHLRLLEF